MAIDFHAHLASPQPGAPPFLRAMFDVEGYLEHQAAAGIETTVLSYAPAEVRGAPEELEEAKREHAFLGELIAAHPGRLQALAGVDPLGGPEWLDEGARALDAGFAGLCFPSSSRGRYLDAPEAQDAFALAQERGALVFLHPSESPVGMERFGHGMLAGWVGRPYDTGICLARLLLTDTLARHPGVRLVVAHGGGTLPMLLGRIDMVHAGAARMAAMKRGPGGPGGPGGGPPKGGPPGPPGDGAPLALALEGPPPSTRLNNIWLDTATHHPAGVQAALAAVGPERVVLGTDHPPADDSPQPTLDMLDALGLPDAVSQAILTDNARALLAPAD